MLLVNPKDYYAISGSDDNIMVSLSISSHFFVMYYPHFFHYNFDCYSKDLELGREKIIVRLRRILAELVIANLHKEEGSLLKEKSILYQVMLLVTNYFKVEKEESSHRDNMDERISRIIQMLELEYAQPLTLSEVAESEYLSPSYLSRYFKQMTGMGFLEYLKSIRLRHSVEDLRHTSETIFQIAVNNGFSTAKNFTAAFKAEYQQTPAQYRKENRDQSIQNVTEQSTKEKRMVESPEALIQLAKYLENSEDHHVLTDEIPIEDRHILLKKPKLTEQLPQEKHLVFVGELKELLNETVREQVLLTHQKMRIDFIGIQNLFTSGVLTVDVETDEAIPTTPKYAKSDMALQFLKERDISVFLRIAFKEIMVREEAFFSEFEQFLAHAIQLFGRGYVNRWKILYFVPAETAILSHELERIYLRIYQLKERFGLRTEFGTFFPYNEGRDCLSIHHQWQFNQTDKIDFISFNADQNEVVDFSKVKDDIFYESQHYILNKTLKLKRFLKKHQLNKPLYLERWNTLTGNTRYTNGMFFRGALILKTVLDLANEVEGIGFWISNEVHERIGESRDILVDGLELFHFFNGRRPVFYTLLLKERLYGELIAKGDDYLMTRNDEGYQLLLYNEKNFNPRYSVDKLFVRSHRKELHLQIEGIEEGAYQVRKYYFDSKNGSLYSKWEQLNSKYGLDNEIIDYITNTSLPKLEISDEHITDTWGFFASMTSNAVQLIELRRAILP